MATSDVNNTIMLNVSRTSPRLQYKYNSATAAHPGDILTITYSATDGSRLLELQPDTDTPARPIICIANTRQGKTIDDTYTLGEIVYAVECRRGDVVLARARFVDDVEVFVGQVLSCYGSGFDGQLRITFATPTELSAILVRVLEYKLVPAIATTALVKVEVL